MKSTYNTRRKSVSLTALGVQLPGRSRASTESKHDSSNADSAARNDTSTSHSPPSKRVKTSHSPASPSRASPTRPASRPRKGSSPTPATADQTKSKSKHAGTAATTPASPAKSSRPKSRQLEYTPPPSPVDPTESKIDYDAIKDDIVEEVVAQLEKTGNRPHLIRELAAVLATTNDSVTSSANAPALLSSRLASFMKRGCWGSSNQCPVGKELIPVHPRKVFYYLTDRPRQELPNTSDDIYGPLGITSPTAITSPPVATPTSAGVGIMGPPSQLPLKRSFEPVLAKFHNDSPPLSNASATGDDDSTANADERRERWAPSPSPEVDLTIHEVHSEYGDEPADKTRKDGSGSAAAQSVHNVSRGHGFKQELEPPRQLHLNTRAQSPQVERDEGNFRDMVVSMRNSPPKEPATPVENKMDGVVVKEEDRETRRLPEYEMDSYTSAPHQHASSPAFPAQAATFTPKQAPMQVAKAPGVEDILMTDDDDLGSGLYRWDLNAPKDIDVDELDLLLEGC